LAVDPGLELEVRRFAGALWFPRRAIRAIRHHRGGLGAAPSLEECHFMRLL
jgi:hypothetical protein